MTIKHILTKECPKCLEVKFIFDFGVSSITKMRLNSYCKVCKNNRTKELNRIKNPNLVSRGIRSKEFRENISLRKYGNTLSEETKDKLSKSMQGKNLGRPISEKQKNQISKTLMGIPTGRSGPLSNLYIDGRHKNNYSERQVAFNSSEYKIWRKSIFERDNYTCQMCGQRGGDLEADHIIPWAQSIELRYELSNGRVLCIKCHRQTPTYGVKSICYNY